MATKSRVKRGKRKAVAKAQTKVVYRTKRLYRSANERILGGVCGGIGEYTGTDPTVIRLLWVLLTLISFGTGVIAYIIAWIIIPRNPRHEWKD